MKANVLAFAAAFVLGLTGCTSPGSKVGVTAHSPLTPQISVVTGGTGEYVIVDQDPIVVTTKGRSRIVWTVVTPGYAFDKTRNGIVLTLKKGKGGLSGCGIVSATQFACDNDNRGKDFYTYEIFLVSSTGKMLRVDPSFFND